MKNMDEFEKMMNVEEVSDEEMEGVAGGYSYNPVFCEICGEQIISREYGCSKCRTGKFGELENIMKLIDEVEARRAGGQAKEENGGRIEIEGINQNHVPKICLN